MLHAKERPARSVVALEVGCLIAAAALAVVLMPDANWDLGLLALLLSLSVASDLLATPIRAEKLKVSGSFIAIAIAMVLLGAVPAALLGIATMLIGWLRWRERPHYLLNNVAAYATFPLIGGAVFHAVSTTAGLVPSMPAYALLVLGVFGLALALNFAMVVGYGAYVTRASMRDKIETALLPLLP